jgi:multiple sugar transport system ATP-binding protein
MSIEIRGINKKFGTFVALEDVSLTIPSGHLTALLGPSGGGKSTLLRIIAGLETQTSGKISIGGQVVDHLPPARRGIAMVFQSYALYPHLDVAGNWALGLKQAGESAALITERTKEAARILALESLLQRKPSELSGGQRQRVAIARALLAEPRILILDDATSSVDATTESQIKTALTEVMEGRTTFVIAHRLSTIALADEVVVLEDGRVAARGTHSELLERSPLYREIAEKGLPDQVFLTREDPEREVAGL